MSKKVIRLTETDLENIVKKILSEQSQGGELLPAPGGFFKVQGNSLFWTSDKNQYIKIWEIGSEPTYRVNSASGSFEPTGYIGRQEPIFSSLEYRDDTFAQMRADNTLPKAYDWDLQVNDDSFLFYGLNEKGEIYGSASSLIVVTRQQLKNRDFLWRQGAISSVTNKMRLSREGEVKWGETFVRLGRDRFILAVLSTGTPIRYVTLPERIRLSLPLEDQFEYDTVDFVNDAKTMEKINEFISKLKEYDEKYPEDFRNHVKTTKPVVYGYASIDGDPEENITGKFSPCRGEKTRGEYNKCLSQHRADKVAEILNRELADVEMNVFTASGEGETDRFAKGMKWPQVTDSSKTAPNRRVETNIGEFVYEN
jgi:outer membrane protein OmpA-like peptidoglycan-associated protein